jgi:hypothetical protein
MYLSGCISECLYSLLFFQACILYKLDLKFQFLRYRKHTDYPVQSPTHFGNITFYFGHQKKHITYVFRVKSRLI